MIVIHSILQNNLTFLAYSVLKLSADDEQFFANIRAEFMKGVLPKMQRIHRFQGRTCALRWCAPGGAKCTACNAFAMHVWR
jgi:hypothetical protein